MPKATEKVTNPIEISETLLAEIRLTLSDDAEKKLLPLMENSYGELMDEMAGCNLHPLAALCLLNKHLTHVIDEKITTMITNQHDDPKVLSEFHARYCEFLDEVACETQSGTSQVSA